MATMQRSAEHTRKRQPSQSLQPNAWPVAVPRTDIQETEKTVLLFVEMPGVRESDVEITLDKNTLNIAAERHLSPPEGFEALHTEFRPVRFERSFSLSFDFQRDNLEAILKHGVLHLVLHKVQSAQPKKIAVKAG